MFYKKYLVLMFLFITIIFSNIGNTFAINNDEIYKQMIKNLYMNYNNSFNTINGTNTIIKNSNNNKTNINNNNNNSKQVKLNLWIGKYKNEIDQKAEEKRQKISKILQQYILGTLNTKTDVNVDLLNSVSKLTKKGAILVYLDFNSNNYFEFNNIKKTLVVLPYKITVNGQEKQSISVIQTKIDGIFGSKNNEEKKLNNLKKLFNNYHIKYLVFNNITSSKNSNNISMYLGEKYSFFTKFPIKFIASSYYKLDDLSFIKRKNIKNTIKTLNQNKTFYLWGVTNEKEIKKFYANLGQNTFDRGNLIAYIKFDNGIKYVLKGINATYNNKTKSYKLIPENFYTLQFGDKTWGNKINPQYNYKFEKTYNYLYYIILSILGGIFSAYLLFKTNYTKKIKAILSEWSDKI